MNPGIFEMNMANAVQERPETTKVKPTSPIVEVFSALMDGRDASIKNKDLSINRIKELASRAVGGDRMAESELNAIQAYAIQPKLLSRIKILDFMGRYHTIPYNEVPYITTYKYEGVDARWQASSGDVPFASYSMRRYPVATQTISSGFSVDYRELQTGNFAGSVAEGHRQVLTDMENKAVYYVVAKLYDAVKNAKGVKHFAESQGITKTAVDNMLAAMRRYGKVNICGDYAVISQLNGFAGYTTVGSAVIPFGGDAASDEIRRIGHLSLYNGSHVVEIPNALNFMKILTDDNNNKSYDLYMPQGLLYFVPQGVGVPPLQIFRRGGVTTMTGDDIVTRQHMTRFDMEIGAGVAEGLEDWIGLISDSNFDAPALP